MITGHVPTASFPRLILPLSLHLREKPLSTHAPLCVCVCMSVCFDMRKVTQVNVAMHK